MTDHALTVDLEEWFQVLNLRGHFPPESWDGLERRAVEPTTRLLDLLDRYQVRATFFCLGWLVEREPELVTAIKARGHEIASHGYGHQRLHELGPQGFRQDLARASRVIRAVTGEEPRGFRACSFSVTRETAWAFAALVEAGFQFDSSVYPVTHPDYGWPAFPPGPVKLSIDQQELVEFPPLTFSFLGRHWAVGGGGYLRLLPVALISRVLRRRDRQGISGCLYLHPWEFDPGQPRINAGWLKSSRHYMNLARTMTKLEYLLKRHSFKPLGAVITAGPEPPRFSP